MWFLLPDITVAVNNLASQCASHSILTTYQLKLITDTCIIILSSKYLFITNLLGLMVYLLFAILSENGYLPNLTKPLQKLAHPFAFS